MTCTRAQEFLAQEQVEVAETTDAKKQRMGAEGALAVARGVSTLVVAKGKKVVRVDMKRAAPADEELLALLLGPSGNLRAPTLRKGTTLLVGFSPEAYAEAFSPRAAARK